MDSHSLTEFDQEILFLTDLKHLFALKVQLTRHFSVVGLEDDKINKNYLINHFKFQFYVSNIDVEVDIFYLVVHDKLNPT